MFLKKLMILLLYISYILVISRFLW